MRKLLPRINFKFVGLLLFLVVLLFVFFKPAISFAAPDPTTDPTTTTTTTTEEPTPATGWHKDPEVTFVGKTASRSAQFLDWTLQNYNWICVTKISEGQCDNTGDPLITFWATIRNIVYAIIALFVLATAFILIITRGQNITVMRFIPRFIFIVVLIYFSFTLVQFIYTATDIVQGFFLKPGSTYISTKDLLYMGFNYDFQGFRYVDDKGTYDESAFISLLLVRLTAITYYVMTGILIVRKIILWFFIIISPIFPLLIFYKPLRNTAKIWLGEFFRWLLYAPLFAVFLQGLVVVWKAGIPLAFNTTAAKAGTVVYPTAISILLGGPGQEIFYKGPLNSNSVNQPDTFALYVVALLMLWVVILLPFLLLKIFLDYLGTLSIDSGLIMRNIKNRQLPFLGPSGSPSVPPAPPGKTQPSGMAKSLPFFSGHAAAVPVHYQTSVQSSVKESTEILKSANLSVPRMRDIANYETSLMSDKALARAQVSTVNSTLAKIANPAAATSISEREKFSTVRQKLLEQKQKGNPIAASVLSASAVTVTNTASATSSATTSATNVTTRQEQVAHVSRVLKEISNPAAVVGITQQQKAAKLKQELFDKKQKGDKLAASILETQEQIEKSSTVEQKEQSETKLIEELLVAEKNGDTLAKELLPAAVEQTKTESLPMVNRVQQVSLEDYEEVRKLWTENYQTIEPPKALNGEQVNREEWIKNDIDKINQAITLLSGVDQQRVNQGMSMVSSILPFLLIGGFSKSEVIAYLKAKMEAGKEVLNSLKKKEENEETMVDRKTESAQGGAKQEAEAQLPTEGEGSAKPLKDLEDAPILGEEKKPGPGDQNSGTNNL